MKLDEAIKNLTEIPIDLQAMLTEDDFIAIKLGIEALKQLKLYRFHKTIDAYVLLPGETPENYHPNTVEILNRLKESPLGREPKA